MNSPCVTMVDYGVGNVASLSNMLDHVDATSRLTDDPDVIASASHILLPGVGSFGHAMSILRARGLDRAVRSAVDNGAFLLGVCLGMQLLARHSEEGGVQGLGLIEADVRRIVPSTPSTKVPHMGWNNVRPCRPNWMIGSDDARFYFAHSYHMVCDDAGDVLGIVEYDGIKTVAVGRGRVFGAQFHPEKSHRFGMTLLSNFAKLAA